MALNDMNDLMRSTQSRMTKATLVGREIRLTLGPNLPFRVNMPLGANKERHTNREISKLESCMKSTARNPDIIVDLSIYQGTNRLYTNLLELFPGPVGVLPHYYAISDDEIDDKLFLDEIGRAVNAGISYFSFHLTAQPHLFEKAKSSRRLPITSRGGGIVLNDMLRKGVDKNVFERNWDRIIDILAGTGVVVSVASSFRSADCGSAMDEVHCLEIELQNQFIEELHSNNISTMREGIGHGYLNQIDNFVSLLLKQPQQPPLMALGPVAIDGAGNQDPLSASMGVARLAMYPNFAAAQLITRQEHSGGIPSKSALSEGLQIALVSADTINASRGFGARSGVVALHRESEQSCVTIPMAGRHAAGRHSVTSGCSRCEDRCPLYLSDGEERNSIKYVLREALPLDWAKHACDLVDEVEALNYGSLVLFGSTAKKHFCFAEIDGQIRIQSDLEFNIITEKEVTAEQVKIISSLVEKYNNLLKSGQPLFDVDIRLRTVNSLEEIDQYAFINRSLYCYGIVSGDELSVYEVSDTDMILSSDIPFHFLRSALEWVLLRLAYISREEMSDKEWWRSAIGASLVCKLTPILCHEAGVPWTGTSKDSLTLKLANKSGRLENFSSIVSIAWDARMDTSGELLRSSVLSFEDVSQFLRHTHNYATSLVSDVRSPDSLLDKMADLSIDESAWGEPTDVWWEGVGDVFSFLHETYRANNPMFSNRYKMHLGDS